MIRYVLLAQIGVQEYLLMMVFSCWSEFLDVLVISLELVMTTILLKG